MTTTNEVPASASVGAQLVAVAQQAVTGGHAESISAWTNDASRLKADHDRRLQALDYFWPLTRPSMGEPPKTRLRDAARRARDRATHQGNLEQRDPGRRCQAHHSGVNGMRRSPGSEVRMSSPSDGSHLRKQPRFT